jgi:hypothetical protein
MRAGGRGKRSAAAAWAKRKEPGHGMGEGRAQSSSRQGRGGALDAMSMRRPVLRHHVRVEESGCRRNVRRGGFQLLARLTAMTAMIVLFWSSATRAQDSPLEETGFEPSVPL